MTTLCVTGHDERLIQDTWHLLETAGLQPAQPLPRDPSMTVQRWHKEVRARLQRSADGPDLASLGRLWEQLAVDLFLGNAEASAWGWADPGSLDLLPFWVGFDRDLCFLLVCERPADALWRALLSPDAAVPHPTEGEVLAKWHDTHSAMLRTHLAHPDRSLLIWQSDAAANPAAFVEQVHRRLAVPGLTAAAEAFASLAPIRHPDALALHLARQIVARHPECEALLRELESVVPPLIEGSEPDADDMAAHDDGQLDIGALVGAYRHLTDRTPELATEQSLKQRITELQGEVENVQALAERAARQAGADFERAQVLEERLRATATENVLLKAQISDANDRADRLAGDLRAAAAKAAEAAALADAQEHALDVAAEDFAHLQRRLDTEAAAKAEALAANEALQREGAVLQSRLDAEGKAKAEALAKLDAESKAREALQARLDAEAKAKGDLQAQLQAEAKAKSEAQAKLDAEIKAKAELQAKSKESETENELLISQLHQVQQELERYYLDNQRLATEANAKAEALAKLDTESKARAALQARLDAEAKAKGDLQAQLQAEAKAKSETQARLDAEGKAKAEALAKLDAESKAKAALQARLDAEAKAKGDLQAQLQAEAKAKSEAQARLDAEGKAKAEAMAKLDAESKAKAALQARLDAEAKAKAEQQARADAEAKARGELQSKLDAETKAKAEATNRLTTEVEAAEGARATLKEVQEENELLLSQLHQVQEEMERLFLDNQRLSTDLGRERQRPTQALLSAEEAYTVEAIASMPERSSAADVAWIVKGLALHRRELPELHLRTRVEGGVAAIIIERPDARHSAPLLRWSVGESRSNEIVLSPARGPGDDGGARARTLAQLASSDWSLLLSLPRMLSQALRDRRVALPAGHDAKALIQALGRTQQMLARLPHVLRFDSVELFGQQTTEVRAVLALRLSQLSHQGRRVAQFDFQLQASVAGGRLAAPAYLILGEESVGSPLETWQPNARNGGGQPMLGLVLQPDESMAAPWRILSPNDQLFLSMLLDTLPLMLISLQQRGVSSDVGWIAWLEFAGQLREWLADRALPGRLPATAATRTETPTPLASPEARADDAGAAALAMPSVPPSDPPADVKETLALSPTAPSADPPRREVADEVAVSSSARDSLDVPAAGQVAEPVPAPAPDQGSAQEGEPRDPVDAPSAPVRSEDPREPDAAVVREQADTAVPRGVAGGSATSGKQPAKSAARRGAAAPPQPTPTGPRGESRPDGEVPGALASVESASATQAVLRKVPAVRRPAPAPTASKASASSQGVRSTDVTGARRSRGKEGAARDEGDPVAVAVAAPTGARGRTRG